LIEELEGVVEDGEGVRIGGTESGGRVPRDVAGD
jgi:hypothetical protein